MVLPAFYSVAAVLPEGFRYLLGFMKGLKTCILFLILLDTPVGCILDGLPDDMIFRLI